MEVLANPENVQRIDCLVEDVHETLMEYQVCILKYLFFTVPDISIRLHCNRISSTGVVSLL